PTSPTNLEPRCRVEHRIKTFTDTTVEPDGAGGLWLTLPSGRRYHRPAEPMLDHPGLITGPRDTDHDTTAGDPDPPATTTTTTPAPDTTELDIPPF
ncbi:MAG: hypothetical protein LH461_09955, partial [Spirochaetaceae bacterium]|nr:hypothetical protein [Spirochaetaceae bacterium]